MIRKLKDDRVMTAGPTSWASEKLCLLGSFQKSALLSMQIFLPQQVSELCCYTGQLCGELLRIFVVGLFVGLFVWVFFVWFFYYLFFKSIGNLEDY